MNNNAKLLYEGFARLSDFPLDSTNFWPTYTDMLQYIQKSKISHKGQLLVVYDDKDELNNSLYFLKANTREFYKVPNSSEITKLIDEGFKEITQNESFADILDRLEKLESEGLSKEEIEALKKEIIKYVEDTYLVKEKLKESIEEVLANKVFEGLDETIEKLELVAEWIEANNDGLIIAERLFDFFETYNNRINENRLDINRNTYDITELQTTTTKLTSDTEDIKENYISNKKFNEIVGEKLQVERYIKCGFTGSGTHVVSNEPLDSNIKVTEVSVELNEPGNSYTGQDNEFTVGLYFPSDFTIVFVSKYGEVPEPITNTAIINNLPFLTDDNFNFVGWYTDEFYEVPAKLGRIYSDVTLYAKWVKKSKFENVTIKGYNGGIYLEFDEIVGYDKYAVYYAPLGSEDFKKASILNKLGNRYYCDILGTSAGEYSVLINSYDVTQLLTVTVTEDLKELGFSSNTGAYNSDGSLKENAIVLYVTEENKNSIEFTYVENETQKEAVGLCNILKVIQYIKNPVCIRLGSSINADTWTEKEYSEKIIGNNDIELKLTMDEYQLSANGFNSLSGNVAQLSGITNRIIYNEDNGTYTSEFNLINIPNVSNLTIEGVGPNISLVNAGFSFINSSNIEIKNIKFVNYPENAIRVYSDNNLSNIWIHNCEFEKGRNTWIVNENDNKVNGDTTILANSFKKISISNCKFLNNEKSILLNNSDLVNINNSYFLNSVSKTPEVINGRVHIFDSIFEYSDDYTVSSNEILNISENSKVILENSYLICNSKKSIVKYDETSLLTMYNNTIENNLETSYTFENISEIESRNSFVLNIFSELYSDILDFYYSAESKADKENIMELSGRYFVYTNGVINDHLYDADEYWGIIDYEKGDMTEGKLYNTLVTSDDIDLESPGKYVYDTQYSSSYSDLTLYVRSPIGISGTVIIKYIKNI